jgi:predicted flap endonuclease-1-like 5' DNA nuclease
MSTHWTCWLGTVAGAGFLGWGIKGLMLGTVIDDKRREVERLASKVAMLTKLANQPPEVRTVEKRVEVPVERVVVKRVEVPVEKIIEKLVEVPIEKTVEKVVDRLVENPEHLARIKALEGEVAVIVGLLGQIAQLQTVSSQAGGRGSEGRVVVPIDDPEQLTRIKALEGEVAVIDDLRVQIAELQAASAQVGKKIVEKRNESPAEQNGKVPVDNPEHLARIRTLEAEVAMIGELRAQIAELRALSAGAGEKGVETPIEAAGEKNGRGPVDNPEHLARIKELEDEVAEIAELRTKITELWKSFVQDGEKVIEAPGETPREKNRELPVIQVSEHRGRLDHAWAAAQSEEGSAGAESPDDLKQIRGVGPALERFLHKRGVFWFSQVATWSSADIDKFEFLLPNFGGRIQRENWVGSAKVEYYKKYKQWLGDGEPPTTTPEMH